jgi:ribosomal protein L40E
MRDLSVIIPARNEEWLKRTVEDVLAHAERDTEVIVLCDGGWPPVALDTHPNLQVLYVPTSIGQRAATNIGVKLSTATYVMKLDAHVSMSQGFDRVLIEAAERLGPDVVQIPAQRHLHVYDQLCKKCKHRADQAPHWAGKCPKCGSKDLDRIVIWEARKKPTTTSWRLDETLHFQYDREGEKRQPAGDICDVMTSLGACFFMERAYFEKLGGLDEAHGSWGCYGQEIALKTWLSGGRHVVNKACWFAHFFRVGGIGFPYEITGAQQDKARDYARSIWSNNAWPQQIYPLKWVIDKFAPLPGWHDQVGAKALAQVEKAAKKFKPATVAPAPVAASRPGTAGCVYYSDCLPDHAVLEPVRQSIANSGLPIVAVTLKPIDWPEARSIVLDLERGYLAMFKQILAGLEALDTEVAFLVEHDVLYHPSHFAFRPDRADVYY